MGKLHVAGGVLASSTPAQMKEFYAQVETGRISKENFQIFIRNPENQSLFHMNDDGQK